MKEEISCAAMLIKGKDEQGDVVCFTPRPGRHHTIIHALAHAGMDIPIGGPERGHYQGFTTTEGRFVERKEARKIADEAEQTSERDQHFDDLFSEDLW